MVTTSHTPPQDERIRDEIRVTQNISLSREDRDAMRGLAERYHGGNVSHLVRAMLRMRLAMEATNGRDGTA